MEFSFCLDNKYTFSYNLQITKERYLSNSVSTIYLLLQTFHISESTQENFRIYQLYAAAN